MGRFIFLNHTADLQVECRAESFPELLKTAADALYAAALRVRGRRANATETFEVSAETLDGLLVRWLQELIYLMETKRFVGTEFGLDEPAPGTLQATVRGYTYGPDERAAEIKAATYHELEVVKSPEGFYARVTFDL